MRYLLRVTITAGSLLLLGQEEPASAQKVMADGIKDLATQIATNVAKEQKRKIAVLPFRELAGQPTVLGTYISEELVTDLFTIGGLDIVERGMLDKLIGEIRLGQTGLIDPDTAKKVGKIAGVDAIVTGTITDLQSYVAINCRLIDAQTGHIFSAAQTKIVKDGDVQKIMGAQLSAAGEPAKPFSEQSETANAEKSKGMSGQQQENEGFLFDLKGCSISGNTVLCAILITNKGEDHSLRLWGSEARLISDDGAEFRATEIFIGSDKGVTWAESILVSGISMKARVIFSVAPEIKKAALLEIFAEGRTRFTVRFRNVSLTRP